MKNKTFILTKKDIKDLQKWSKTEYARNVKNEVGDNLINYVPIRDINIIIEGGSSIICYAKGSTLKIYERKDNKKVGHYIYKMTSNPELKDFRLACLKYAHPQKRKKCMKEIHAFWNPSQDENFSLWTNLMYFLLSTKEYYSREEVDVEADAKAETSTKNKSPDKSSDKKVSSNRKTTYIKKVGPEPVKSEKTPKHHRSPSGEFEVRGHFRHYQSGKVIWIDPFIKGKKNKSQPAKERVYKISAVI